MAKAPTAAVFDLDRTLLAGSSAPTFSKHLGEAGMGGDLSVPGLDLYYRGYEMFGENPAVMQLARFAVRASAGWSVDKVTAATNNAATELLEQVQPQVPRLLDEHRAAGRTLVMATTSPEPFVAPLAERLGFDVVIATKWKHHDGVYTGEGDGPFLWGRAKRDAVRDWAAASGTDLRRSYGYSDSAYDVPLLKAVGNPVAVNPDPLLTAIATLNRWEIRHLDVPRGVVKVAGFELQEWFRPFGRPELLPNARFDFNGLANIPTEGPAILVFNHRSYFDPTVVGLALAQAGRSARFLGKEGEVFDAPLVGQLVAAMGGIRVDRGTGSDEPLDRAIEAIESGELIAMAPQGTIPRGPAFFEPELKARWGAARLAHATRAPVVPMGLWGTEKVWPRSARLPSFNLTDPPDVLCRVGKPVDLKFRSVKADSERMMSSIVDLLPPEARVKREPTGRRACRNLSAGLLR